MFGMPKYSTRVARELEHTKHRLLSARAGKEVADAEVAVYEARVARLAKEAEEIATCAHAAQHPSFMERIGWRK